MEIVIKIPEDDYKRIVKYGMTVFGSDEDIYMLEQALENGVVLPKGHRRLIEENEELFQSIRQYCGKDATCEVFENAPTIVEADKENR